MTEEVPSGMRELNKDASIAYQKTSQNLFPVKSEDEKKIKQQQALNEQIKEAQILQVLKKEEAVKADAKRQKEIAFASGSGVRSQSAVLALIVVLVFILIVGSIILVIYGVKEFMKCPMNDAGTKPGNHTAQKIGCTNTMFGSMASLMSSMVKMGVGVAKAGVSDVNQAIAALS